MYCDIKNYIYYHFTYSSNAFTKKYKSLYFKKKKKYKKLVLKTVEKEAN